QANLGDPFEEHHRRPLLEHLEDYRRYLLADGCCAAHVAKTCARVRGVLKGTGLVFATDLRPEPVVEFLHTLRCDPPKPELPTGKEWFTPAELVRAMGGKRPPQLARLLRREGLATIGGGRGRRYPRATIEALQNALHRGISVSTSNAYLAAAKSFSR